MIAPSTGMKPGERYTVESIERAHHFPGFFLDGKYYLGPELLTAVGWLEGEQFFYDELDPTGEPVFADRVAGVIEDLTLTLADGARLQLNRMPYEAMSTIRAQEIQEISSSTPAWPVSPGSERSFRSLAILGAGLLLLGICVFRMKRPRARRSQP
jgi:hypothetical protein